MSTGSGGFDLRRLVAQAIPLTVVPSLSSKKAHPLGYGLKNNHSFSIGSGVPGLRLPKLPAAVENLSGQIAAIEIPGVDDGMKEAAWHALLAKPSLLVPLVPLTEEDALYAGIDVASSEIGRLKAVGLSAVLRDSEMVLQSGELHSPPFAAHGRITLLGREDAPHIAVDGWVDITWTSSTASLVRGLRELHRDAEPSFRAVKSGARVGLLISEPFFGSLGDVGVERLRSIAAVHKLQLEFYRYSASVRGSLKLMLEREPPPYLLIAVDRWDDVGDLVAAYENTLGGRVRSFRSLDLFSFDSELCDFLCGLVGVNAGLLPLEVIAEEEAAPKGDSLPDWPIQKFGERRRHNSFGHIVESLDDGRWYVRDDTGHAQCRFKRYKLIARTFEHEADLDKDGIVIPKYKGERGKRIDYDETFGL